MPKPTLQTLLKGRKVAKARVRKTEVFLEFDDGWRLFVNATIDEKKRLAVDVSVTGGDDTDE